DRNIDHALPMNQWASIAFVAGPARKSPLHHNVFTAEWTVPVTARWTEYGDDRRAHRRGKMQRPRVSSDEQPSRFTQSYEFFQSGGNLANAAAGGPHQPAPHFFLAGAPGNDDRMAVAHQPGGELAVSLRFPALGYPVATRIYHDVI